jgi:hypothetical protein
MTLKKLQTEKEGAYGIALLSILSSEMYLRVIR